MGDALLDRLSVKALDEKIYRLIAIGIYLIMTQT
jgi:hypothetical protein